MTLSTYDAHSASYVHLLQQDAEDPLEQTPVMHKAPECPWTHAAERCTPYFCPKSRAFPMLDPRLMVQITPIWNTPQTCITLWRGMPHHMPLHASDLIPREPREDIRAGGLHPEKVRPACLHQKGLPTYSTPRGSTLQGTRAGGTGLAAPVNHNSQHRQHQYGHQPPTAYVTTAKGRGTSAQIFNINTTSTAVLREGHPSPGPEPKKKNGIELRDNEYEQGQPLLRPPFGKWEMVLTEGSMGSQVAHQSWRGMAYKISRGRPSLCIGLTWIIQALIVAYLTICISHATQQGMDQPKTQPSKNRAYKSTGCQKKMPRHNGLHHLRNSQILLGNLPHHAKKARALQSKRARQRLQPRWNIYFHMNIRHQPTKVPSPANTSLMGGNSQTTLTDSRPTRGQLRRLYPQVHWCPQEAMYCWIHAHNMLLQTNNMSPQQVEHSLTQEIQKPNCEGRDNIRLSFNIRGPFGTMAINRYLHNHAEAQVYYKVVASEQQTERGLDEAQFQQCLPPGTKGACIAITLQDSPTGHMKCIRYISQDSTWYALDSMLPPYITPLKTEQDWKAHTQNAQIYALVETTHYQGPPMGARNPPTTDSAPYEEHSYDIDKPLLLHRDQIREVQSTHYSHRAHTAHNATGNSSSPRIITIEDRDPPQDTTSKPIQTGIPPQETLPQKISKIIPPIRPLQPRPNKSKKSNAAQGSKDIRHFLTGTKRPCEAAPEPKDAPPKHHKPCSQTGTASPKPHQSGQRPPRIQKQRRKNRPPPQRTKPPAQAKDTPWKRLAVKKKSIKRQYTKLKRYTESITQAHTKIPPPMIFKECSPTTEQIKILTINGRGLKTKISILRQVLTLQPDVIIWTEHQMAAGTTVPRWVTILLQGYKWGSSNLPRIKGQAGVLMAIHKDLLAGTEVHIPPLPVETQGYIYQMVLHRPESTPMRITGTYLPTGKGAQFIRPTLYKFLQECLNTNKEQVHIMAGDMNATLYDTDRATGRPSRWDRGYRQFVNETGLQPLDGPTSQEGAPARHRTYRKEGADGPAISRIDDILVKGIDGQITKLGIQIMDTQVLPTDHQGLYTNLPYSVLQQLPMPVQDPQDHISPKKRLVTPMSKEDKQTLTQTIEEQQALPILSLWKELKETLDTKVLPYWNQQEDTTLAGTTTPKWAPQECLQHMVDTMGASLT
jgi:hypothetical protein